MAKKQTTKKKASKTRTTNKVFKKALAIARADKPLRRTIRCATVGANVTVNSAFGRLIEVHCHGNGVTAFLSVPNARALISALNRAIDMKERGRAKLDPSRHRAGSRATAELLGAAASKPTRSPQRIRMIDRARAQEISRDLAKRGCCGGDTTCVNPVPPSITDPAFPEKDGAS